jgi:hypothetical protein
MDKGSMQAVEQRRDLFQERNNIHTRQRNTYILHCCMYNNNTVEASTRRGTTALVYCLIKSSLYCIQVLYTGSGVHPTGQTVTRDVASSPQGSPELWPRPGGEEVKGPTSGAVPVDETGTSSVEAVKAPPVLGVQKPPRRVAKRFRERLVVVPEKRKVKTQRV